MPLEVKVRNPRKFINDVIKELMPKNSKITIGVLDRPHYQRMEGMSIHSKGMKGVSALTSAEIARAHEYGIGVPRRSFLRDTMKKWLLFDARKTTEEDYKRVDFYLKNLSKKIYERVQEAFDTNGWGSWKDLSDDYMKRTGRSLPALTDTGQMRGAIYVEYAGETKSGKAISGIGAKPKRSDYGVSHKAGEKYRKEGENIILRSFFESAWRRMGGNQ